MLYRRHLVWEKGRKKKTPRPNEKRHVEIDGWNWMRVAVDRERWREVGEVYIQQLTVEGRL
jgi:hypothetical protein